MRKSLFNDKHEKRGLSPRVRGMLSVVEEAIGRDPSIGTLSA